ncbi:MAG: DUF2199 domain-containing protein [Sphingomonadales bacterium]|nr:DUF2199 domain-containing protein [Sphingomonadales bacterium]
MTTGGLFGKLFKRPEPSALEILESVRWTCVNCDVVHRGMFDIAAHAPDHWDGTGPLEPNGALRLDGDFLSEDFCVIGGEHFFIRCVFPIPVHGLRDRFGFCIWSTLSRENFGRYVDGFDRGGYGDAGPWCGWFSNSLRGFPETINQGCWVQPRAARQRPVIHLDDADHPLSIAQQNGITPERLLELYAEYGHAPTR